MLRYEIKTDGKPTCIDIGVEVKKPTKVKIVVLNPNKRGCIYLDRWQTVKQKGEFEARLPITPENVLVLIQSEGNSDDDNIRLTKLKKKPLKQHMNCIKSSKKVSEFIKFAEQMSENATILATGTYYSDAGKFRIDYLPVIREKGKVLNTPARISNRTGRIEVSKSAFARYTVPMRMAILLHEFSHFNLNVVQKDEIEADLNALKIYLGLGYPVVEAHKSFLQVFKKHPTKQNEERYKYLKTFIDNFDKIKYRICLP